MYKLDNDSAVDKMPAIQQKQGMGGWFTEGSDSQMPSYPGCDWFNIVQAEILNVLIEAGVLPEKNTLNQLSSSIKKLITTNTEAFITQDDAKAKYRSRAIELYDNVNLNDLIEPNEYYQPLNVQALNGRNYPASEAGSLSVYKAAGIVQIYRVYTDARTYVRALYMDVWSEWSLQYDTKHRPTPEEIGALPISYTPPIIPVRSVWLWSGDEVYPVTVTTPADAGIVCVCFKGNGYAVWKSFPLNMVTSGQICGDIDHGGDNSDRDATTGVWITKHSPTQVTLTPISTKGSASRATHITYIGFIY